MNKRAVIGPVLILLGVYLILNRGGELDAGTIFGTFWATIFIIPVGLFFHWMYFSMTNRRHAGLLVPGGILLTVGLVCQVSMLTGEWGTTWPGFILAPAVGLLELYWFGNRNKWLLVPINILLVISLLFFAVFTVEALFNRTIMGQPFIAVALIAAGLAFMLLKKKQV
ncbi:hypothetical protein [Gorillibacterium sp. CAU 1737]|uniref:hypothetical protein n=1 Tax=Gorillibacterium sp. CAU 1737 TaxID=3140362 RepID=UPI0032607C7A